MNHYRITWSVRLFDGCRSVHHDYVTHETANKAVEEVRRMHRTSKNGFRIEQVLVERPRTWEVVEVDE